MWFPRFLHVLIALATLAINEGHGSWSPPLEPGRDLAESLAWQDRCLDPAGFYDLGARHLENDHGVVLSYDPLSGRFLSPDPLGHAFSLSLYDYANGDPVNKVDPDGRMASTYGRGEGPSRALGSIGSGLSSLAGSMQPGVVRHAFAYAAGASLTASDFSSPSYMRRGMVSGVMGFSGELNRYTQDRMDQGYSEFSARLGAVSYGVTMPLVGVHEAGTGTDFITGKAVDRSLSENLLKVNGGFLFAAGPYASSARLAASSAPAPARAINTVPSRLSRVVDLEYLNASRLGAPRASEVFVAATDDLAGITTSRGLAQRLTLLDEAGNLRQGPFGVIDFNTPAVGLASPVFRTNPGFLQGGFTRGGAREFSLPNAAIDDLQNVTRRSFP
jgi:RHS repeat-associated protein